MNVNTNNSAAELIESETDTRATTRTRLHDLQNYLHLATMEVELARLEESKSVDCDKLLRILTAFKLSLHELRDHLLSTESKGNQAVDPHRRD